RPKRNLLKLVRRDLAVLPRNALISMSNSSDPYPPMESRLKLTRSCLREFLGRDLRILIITKSDLVVRDLDLISELRAAVTITITTLDEDLAKRLEPRAPTPSKRLDAVEKLSSEGIPVGVRVDPIIPFLNDEGVELLLREVRDAGALHVTSSTFKPRWDSWRRMEEAFPRICEKLKPLYFEEGERIGRSYYLPKPFRFKLMSRVAEESRKLGLTFACCREGFIELNSGGSCDGSHLISPIQGSRGSQP
ncbi:MAG: radical SAM protein, partial [Thaumarchaeota archaeon]